jgi:hypothetical protein
MKKNEDLRKDVQNAIRREPLLNAAETGIKMKVGKHLRNFIYITSLVGIGLCLNSCMAGYVASEPSYVDYARPQRPNDVSIWIDGSWGWNRQSNAYVQNAGYWERPRQGQSYVSGRWESTPKGKHWTKGYWQKQNRQNNQNRQDRKDRQVDNRNR